MKAALALILAIALIGTIGCSAKVPEDSDVSPSAVTDTATPADASVLPTTDSGDTDYLQIGYDVMANERFGELLIGMTESQVIALLGQPDDATEYELWQADGLEHTIWTFIAAGCSMDMSRTPDTSDEAIIASIYANASCTLATQRGIKIGDARDAVLAAYANEIDPASDPDTSGCIVIGSVYGGIQVGIEADAVTFIFIGAGAE